MTSTTLWAVIIAIIVVIAIVAIVATRRRRSQELRAQFGPEYERTVARTGSPQRAEAELAQRERRVRSLDIRSLSHEARDRYVDEWRAVQAQFVDQPSSAVSAADRLVTNVMRDRGYPTGDETQRFQDLSVGHAAVLENYRTARGISLKNERGEATTEELRRAMVAYRALFADLLGTDPVSAPSAGKR